MLLCTRPFADATGNGLCNVREVAVAEVQEEFFDGVLDLDPRMVPRIGTVEAFQIGFVFSNLLGMLQGKLQLMALHGEHPSDTMRGGLQFRREMGGVSHQADVIDLILLGHDGQTVVEQHITPVDGLEIGLATLTMITEHLQHITSQISLLGHALQFLHSLWIMDKAVGGIPTFSHPSPRSPAPDAEGGGEEIAVAAAILRLLVDVEACNHRDALIVLITVEHLLAEREERL